MRLYRTPRSKKIVQNHVKGPGSQSRNVLPPRSSAPTVSRNKHPTFDKYAIGAGTSSSLHRRAARDKPYNFQKLTTIFSGAQISNMAGKYDARVNFDIPGLQAHGLFLKGADELRSSKPLIVLIHGGGTNAQYFDNKVFSSDLNFSQPKIVLVTNYQHPPKVQQSRFRCPEHQPSGLRRQRHPFNENANPKLNSTVRITH